MCRPRLFVAGLVAVAVAMAATLIGGHVYAKDPWWELSAGSSGLCGGHKLDDKNACTKDVCRGGIVHHFPPEGLNDNNACTMDICNPKMGKISHIGVQVDDKNACTKDTCNPITGKVTNALMPIEDDKNACTVDGCNTVTGKATHLPIAGITDNNACTIDACDPATGNITHAAKPADDGNACTVDACDPATGNITNASIVIDDGVSCTVDACDTKSGNISHKLSVSLCQPEVGIAKRCDLDSGMCKPVERKVVTARGFSCILEPWGEVACWGYNNEGVLGSVFDQTVPAEVVPLPTKVPLPTIVSLDAGDDHACAVSNTGQLYCWGKNYSGQLGIEKEFELPSPGAIVAPELPAAYQNIVDINAGNSGNCALLADSRVMCWGNQEIKNNPVSYPVPETGDHFRVIGTKKKPFTGAVALSKGSGHTCALMKENHKVQCWGYNDHGQLGRGTITEFEDKPAPVVNLSGVKSIDTSSNATFAIRINPNAIKSFDVEDIMSWGRNVDVILGYFTVLGFSDPNTGVMYDIEPFHVPNPSNLIGMISAGEKHLQLAARGESHACMLVSSGEVWCWGKPLKKLSPGVSFVDAVKPRMEFVLPDALSIDSIGDTFYNYLMTPPIFTKYYIPRRVCVASATHVKCVVAEAFIDFKKATLVTDKLGCLNVKRVADEQSNSGFSYVCDDVAVTASTPEAPPPSPPPPPPAASAKPYCDSTLQPKCPAVGEFVVCKDNTTPTCAATDEAWTMKPVCKWEGLEGGIAGVVCKEPSSEEVPTSPALPPKEGEGTPGEPAQPASPPPPPPAALANPYCVAMKPTCPTAGDVVVCKVDKIPPIPECSPDPDPYPGYKAVCKWEGLEGGIANVACESTYTEQPPPPQVPPPGKPSGPSPPQ